MGKGVKFTLAVTVSVALLLTTAYISLTNGAFDMALRDVVKTLLRMNPQHDYDLVILEFRLPRIVIALLVGAGLGMAGTVVQSLTRNPLADPGILGINAGAGVAMVIFLFFFQGKMKGTSLAAILAGPAVGLVGGLGAALLIYFFSRVNGRLEAQRLLLTGIAMASGLSAVSVFLTLKMNAKDFETVAVWVSGSIYNANWTYIVAMLPWLLLLTPVLFLRTRMLDVFQLSESSVRGLGAEVDRERALLLLSAIGIVSACVSVSGGIGFIGLMAPHMARRLVGHGHRQLLPMSGLIGALLVMMSDFIAKTVFAPMEMPVGVVIAIIGVPYFVLLLYRNKQRQV
ncbi:FecCD family ABC transporter permease [Paenibacillus whitsoniae]|uniref:Iron ABC transporter permease n=1 Tax=Paenibacillus whitsoniae TaxID=2496558 RepID=A0A3S0BSG1_9BACL|nr:iron ABC transporter permease [Paenibacillus whitsoniae]RTE06433.1 iron ABC transporter permease [Paenibacillus whitsoniae]